MMLSLFISAILAAVPVGETPEQAVTAAAKDLKNVEERLRPYVRYIWRPPANNEDHDEFWRTRSFHLNQLSVEPDIELPRVFGSVARIYTFDYGWSREQWEELKVSEPYFRVPVKDANGKTVSRLQAPWGGQYLAYLVEQTGSVVPIVRGDWLLWQQAIQANRGKAGYYDFLGIKDQKTYDEVVGFSAEALKRFPIELRESVVESTVAEEPRRLERKGKIGGSKWASFDVEQAVGRKNTLQVLGDTYEFDATEQIAHLPNGMLAWGLFNAAGVRQDSAPDKVAGDSLAPRGSKRVHIGLSCIRCHGKNLGFQPIDGFARTTFQKPGGLKSPDPFELKRLRRIYGEPIEPLMDEDRRIYERAVQKATGGWGVRLASEKYAAAFADYEWRTLEQVAMEFNTTPQRFQDIIRVKAANTPEIDALLGYFAGEKFPRDEGQRPRRIPITTFHDAYPAWMTLMQGENK